MKDVPSHDIQRREVPKVGDDQSIHHIKEGDDVDGREKSACRS